MALAGSEKNASPPPGGLSLPPLRRTGEKINWATILFYAQARWGKTHILRTLKGNVLILASELGETRGLNTLGDRDIPWIPIDDEQMMTLVLAELGKGDRVRYPGWDNPFDWVVLDSASNMGYLWFERGKTVIWGENPPLAAEASTRGSDSRLVYGYVAERGRQHMKRLLDLPAHVLIICRESVQEEGEGTKKITYVAPELPGQKLPRELPGWPDATLHGVVHNGNRRIRTKTIAKAVAGIRVPGDISVPELILPDLEDVKDLLLGDKTALQRLTPSAEPSPRART